MGVSIQFLGAAGTVTGSKYLIEGLGKKILVDCGLFQGTREWREKNWDEPPVNLANIDAVLLTHAHIDHTGILPRYFRYGLNCPIYCTRMTGKLSNLLLPDSGRLQEEEAEYRGARGKSRHHPALPLYTEKEAYGVLKLFKGVSFHQEVNLFDRISATWNGMGHILGAASISLNIGNRKITFSGDIGRYDVPILRDPEPVDFGDLLLIESTYGDRLHSADNAETKLAEVVNSTFQRRGVVVIPSFAVGRTQLILYYLKELKAKKIIPDLPVFIDSPMANKATELYSQGVEDFDKPLFDLFKKGENPFSFSNLQFVNDRQDSIRLNSFNEPCIIISASGMLSGGRILHHLLHRISNPANTILFVGFQPPGGRGDWILGGAKSLRILGDDVQIGAQISQISGLSGHGDRDELLKWCKSCKGTPGKVAVVHGEPESAKTFCSTLQTEMKWDSFVAKYLQKIEV